MTGARAGGFAERGADGTIRDVTRAVAEEVPVAIEVNGIGYAVLMATPVDLDDLAHGFVLSERLADGTRDIVDIDRHATAGGTILRVTLADRVSARIHGRVRHRTSESGCGLCGIENLEQAMRPLPPVRARTQADDAAVFAALAALRDHQPLSRATGAVHAAALCSDRGAIRLVREDVGRHNALDKLIGAMARSGYRWDGGFAIVSSRCSYELVEKAVLAGCPMLVAISAPTALALERARAAGLELRVLARSDSMLADALPAPERVDAAVAMA
ncbi:formate dehydrogenase accessory sulfurtransferase FdhD [Sphingomonas donggukensis]|uniref:Sulfur carrier protein FdhD n=1 Tax=Sphingomonas donggukensis TaxID=2949093 RepID=A0ABY4TVR8_9SPHN|nr:formate dehydrogenase accessory sulfurtransferase FdhD [Sphingomonas donggukensis]URW76402.1 formate dehydrogenase accessory sulfurtransferase FdhD [Sphingomonas donggukensis]